MPIGHIVSLPVFLPFPERALDHSMHLYVRATDPHEVDVGYVTNTKKAHAFLWNGSSADVAVSSVEESGDSDGITCDLEAPEVIEARSYQRVVLTVDATEGPLEYEAVLSFLSSCIFDPSITISGTRAPHLSTDTGYMLFPHNWEDGLDETMAWKTDIMTAYDRTEQRVQLRTLPRRFWDLRLLVSGEGRRKLETWLGMRRARNFFVPVWRDAQKTAQAILSGTTSIYLDDVTDNFLTGTPVVIWSSWDNFEIRTINGAGADYISVDSPFMQDWPAGSNVAPARYCLSLETRRVNRFTGDVGDYRLRVFATDDAWEPTSTPLEEYSSIPVCPFIPSWEDGDENFDNKWVQLDNDTGVIEFDIQSEEPVMSREARFLIIGRDNINHFMVFLRERAGRLSPFWLAANDRGFELAMSASAGDTVIEIEPIDYEYALAGSNSREHIEMLTTDGTIIRRRITAVQALPNGNEQLSLDSGLPVDISAATLDRCAWLELVRLDSDEVIMHWVTGECVEVTVPIMVLP